MNDYIKRPKWLEIDQIYKESNLATFLKEVALNRDGNISLDELRKIYLKDKTQFFLLLEEFGLRGFEFIASKSNNLLPKEHFDIDEKLIYCIQHGKRYEKLNFNDFYIGGIVDKFKISSDLFFNYIPLKGFKVINSQINLNALEEAFLKNGFSIITAESIVDVAQKSIEVGIELWHEQNEHQVQENKIKYKTNNIQSNFEKESKTSIEIYFFDRKYQLFRQFCKKENVKYVEDITECLLNTFENEIGVGVGKVKQVKEKLKKVQSIVQVEKEQSIEIPRGYRIEKYFDIRHKDFLEFCRSNQIEEVCELTTTLLNAYRTKKGIGLTKVKKIYEILDRIKDEVSLKKSFNEHIITISQDIYSYIQDMTLAEVLVYYHRNYEGKNFMISELQGKVVKECVLDGELEKFMEGIYVLLNMKSLKENIELSLEELKENERYAVLERCVNRRTLEEIGKDKAVSRERIRQHEKKGIQKLMSKLECNDVLDTIRLIIDVKGSVSTFELSRILEEYYQLFINLIVDGHETKYGIKFFKPFSILYIDESDTVIRTIEGLMVDLPEKFFLEDYIEEIENTIEQLGFNIDVQIEEIENLLLAYGYRQTGKMFSLKKLAVMDMVASLLRVYMKDGIRITEESVKAINELSKNIFNQIIGDSVRAVEATIARTEDVILIGTKKYMYVGNLKLQEDVISEIEDKLDERLEIEPEVGLREIFMSYKDKLIEMGIEEEHGLYSIIKYRNKDKYKYKSLISTFNILKSDIEVVQTEEDRLISYLQQNNGINSIKELSRELKWKEFKIENFACKSKHILKWGRKQVILANQLEVTKEDRIDMENFIANYMKDGYSTSGLLFHKALMDQKLAVFIEKNKIDEYSKFGNVIKFMCKQIKGQGNFLYQLECKYKNISQVLEDKFNTITTRHMIKEFILSYKYKEMMASNIVDNILAEGKYLEISQDEIIPKDQLEVKQETIEAVWTLIEENMEGKPYISLNTIKGYRRKLPSMEHMWNEYLLRTVALYEGDKFRNIRKYFCDYRYDKVILVDSMSPIQTYEDLVYYILKNEYRGNMHEVKIYDYLTEIGIVREQESVCFKKLPYEIQQSERIKIDRLGRVTLHEFEGC